jgi:hypothetical protein
VSHLTSYSGSCGLLYQRIEEVVEPVLEPKRVLEPFTDEIVESAPATMKYKPNRKVVEESVSDFKRVRLLYQTALMVSEMEAVRAEDSEEVGELQPYAVETTGAGLHGATRDWAIVDVPPGTQRVRMDGVGGGSQEISWQRYNGVRRSKFMLDGSPSDEGYGSEVGRPLAGAGAGAIGPRYGPSEGLWTEITKDLVVKEAITQVGYEFEETDDFYYIMSFLKYVSWFSLLPH